MSTRDLIRPIVRGAYDQQKLRIQTGNRIVAAFKAKLGQTPGVTEEDSLSPDAQELLADLRIRYKLLGSAIADFRKTRGKVKAIVGDERVEPQAKPVFVGDDLIESETELALVEQYLDLEDQERRTFKRLDAALQSIPFYAEVLSRIKGIGPAMGGVIIAEIDIGKAEKVSDLWAYAGLDVAQDGRGRSRRAEHLIEREYTNRNGEPAVRMSITFNPFLKTKLMGVLAASFLRTGNARYVEIYHNYRNRIDNHPAHVAKTKGHRHQMALRYTVKIFLQDLYLTWRAFEHLPVTAPYQEDKLGHRH